MPEIPKQLLAGVNGTGDSPLSVNTDSWYVNRVHSHKLCTMH